MSHKPELLATTANVRNLPVGTVARRAITRTKPPTFADVTALAPWLREHALSVSRVCCIRTSDTSSTNFSAMFDLGTRMRPDDPDFVSLRKIGVQIVQPDAEGLRRKHNVMPLRRGSVPGGHGRALLGYLLVLGDTLFILYMSTARKADIAGDTPDQTKNAFTEALLTILRTVRPEVLYTPLVSRVFRNMDFAADVMKALRKLRVRLEAGGEVVKLTGDEAITGLLKGWFASTEADHIVTRLDGIEKNIYEDRNWYLSEKFLPFTWRLKSIEAVSPITGLNERTVISKRELEVVDGAGETLKWFIVEGGKRGVSNHDLGVGLGARGVRTRAPRYAKEGYPTLDQLSQPASGAAVLMREHWINAWRTGVYRRNIRLKADLRNELPGLADRVSEVEDEFGGTQFYLEVEIDMPTPEGGWPVTDEEWESFSAVRFEATPQRLGRAAAKGGTKRPLASLCSYLDEKAYWELSCRNSGRVYSLLMVPRELALTEDGQVKVVPKDWPTAATLNCSLIHKSIGEQIAEAIIGLGDRVGPLELRAAEPRVEAGAKRAEELANAESEVTRIENRLRGIREDKHEIKGDDTLDDEEKDERLDELKEDETKARGELKAARTQVAALHSTDAEQKAAPELRRAETNIHDLLVVAAALIRTDYVAPAELNEVLHRVVRDLRMWPVSRGTAVMWSAKLLVPLRDGGDIEVEVQAKEPLPSGKRHGPRDGDNHARAADPKILAGLFFEDGKTMREIGELRRIDGSGYHKSWLFQHLRRALGTHGVPMRTQNGALDIPSPVIRRGMYRALTSAAGLTPYEGAMGHTYTSMQHWGAVWCQGDDQQIARRVLNLLQSEGCLFEGMPVYDVARRLEVRSTRIVNLTRPESTRPRKGPATTRAAILHKLGDWDNGPVATRLVAGIPCPHNDCFPRVSGLGPGLLVPLWVPELSIGTGPDARHGLICSSCQRRPDDPDVIYPPVYLEPWVGGRRELVVTDGTKTYLGSHLHSEPVPRVA